MKTINNFTVVLICVLSFFIVSFSIYEPATKDNTNEMEQNAAFINLGLPSGTLWKQYNESTAYTYEYAKRYYDGFLPTSGQFQELIDNCTWKWTGNGYKIIGKNGNYIFLKANFTRGDDILGAYWSSTKDDSKCCYGLLLYPSKYKVDRTCNLDDKRNVILCK